MFLLSPLMSLASCSDSGAFSLHQSLEHNLLSKPCHYQGTARSELELSTCQMVFLLQVSHPPPHLSAFFTHRCPTSANEPCFCLHNSLAVWSWSTQALGLQIQYASLYIRGHDVSVYLRGLQNSIEMKKQCGNKLLVLGLREICF